MTNDQYLQPKNTTKEGENHKPQTTTTTTKRNTQRIHCESILWFLKKESEKWVP